MTSFENSMGVTLMIRTFYFLLIKTIICRIGFILFSPNSISSLFVEKNWLKKMNNIVNISYLKVVLLYSKKCRNYAFLWDVSSQNISWTKNTYTVISGSAFHYVPYKFIICWLIWTLCLETNEYRNLSTEDYS